jgi:hypothetical protein
VINGNRTTARGGLHFVLRPKKIQDIPWTIDLDTTTRQHRDLKLVIHAKLDPTPEEALAIARACKNENPEKWMGKVIANHILKDTDLECLESQDTLSRHYRDFEYPHVFGGTFKVKELLFSFGPPDASGSTSPISQHQPIQVAA